MQFMLLLKGDPTVGPEAGHESPHAGTAGAAGNDVERVAQAVEAAGDGPSIREVMEAMNRYHEELTKAGVLLAAEGLLPSAMGGARVVYAKGRKTVVDGPFAEAKELIAGFYVIDVKSREEAIEWASRCPVEYACQGDQEAVVEVRQIAAGG